jgi:hypothetical protein
MSDTEHHSARLRLWRQIHTVEGQSQLEEIADLAHIRGKNVVFMLPGSNTHHPHDHPETLDPLIQKAEFEDDEKMRKSIASYAKEAKRVLRKGNNATLADIIVLSYPSSEGAREQTDLTNNNPDYLRKDAEEVVQQFLLPLIEGKTKLTLFGYSAGSILAENFRRSLVQANKADVLPEIVSITIGNVSKTPRLDITEEDAPPNFTHIVFQSLDDEVTWRRTGFEGTIPEDHELGKASVSPLARNGLLVTSHSTPEGLYWDKSKMELVIITPDPGEMGHNKEFFIKRTTGTTPGVPGLFDAAFNCAVARKSGTIAVTDLIPNIQKKTSALQR